MRMSTPLFTYCGGGSGRRLARLVAGGRESRAQPSPSSGGATLKLLWNCHYSGTQHPLLAFPALTQHLSTENSSPHHEVWGTCPHPLCPGDLPGWALVRCLGLPGNPKLLQAFCTHRFSQVSTRLPV